MVNQDHSGSLYSRIELNPWNIMNLLNVLPGLDNKEMSSVEEDEYGPILFVNKKQQKTV